MNGQVYVLDADSQADLEQFAMVRRQQANAEARDKGIRTLIADLTRLGEGLLGPVNAHFDLETTISTLTDLLSDQTEAEMWALAEDAHSEEVVERQYCREDV